MKEFVALLMLQDLIRQTEAIPESDVGANILAVADGVGYTMIALRRIKQEC